MQFCTYIKMFLRKAAIFCILLQLSAALYSPAALIPRDVATKSFSVGWRTVDSDYSEFIATVSPIDEGENSYPMFINESMATWRNLIPGKNYSISVVAVGRDGDHSKPAVLDVTTEPMPVYNVRVSKFVNPVLTEYSVSGNKTMMFPVYGAVVMWEGPEQGHIDGYDIEVTPPDGSVRLPVVINAGKPVPQPKKKRRVIWGLVPGVNYEFSICSQSNKRLSVHVSADERMPPEIPSAVEITNLTPTSVDLSWDQLHRGLIDGYVIEISPPHGEIVEPLYETEKRRRIEDLIPGSKYKLDIYSTSYDILSFQSRSVHIKTPPLTPLGPVLASDITTTSVVIRWQWPGNNVHYYEVVFYPTKRDYGRLRHRVGDPEVQLNYLEPDTEYSLILFSVANKVYSKPLLAKVRTASLTSARSSTTVVSFGTRSATALNDEPKRRPATTRPMEKKTEDSHMINKETTKSESDFYETPKTTADPLILLTNDAVSVTFQKPQPTTTENMEKLDSGSMTTKQTSATAENWPTTSFESTGSSSTLESSKKITTTKTEVVSKPRHLEEDLLTITTDRKVPKTSLSTFSTKVKLEATKPDANLVKSGTTIMSPTTLKNSPSSSASTTSSRNPGMIKTTEVSMEKTPQSNNDLDAISATYESEWEEPFYEPGIITTAELETIDYGQSDDKESTTAASMESMVSNGHTSLLNTVDLPIETVLPELYLVTTKQTKQFEPHNTTSEEIISFFATDKPSDNTSDVSKPVFTELSEVNIQESTTTANLILESRAPTREENFSVASVERILQEVDKDDSTTTFQGSESTIADILREATSVKVFTPTPATISITETLIEPDDRSTASGKTEILTNSTTFRPRTVETFSTSSLMTSIKQESTDSDTEEILDPSLVPLVSTTVDPNAVSTTISPKYGLTTTKGSKKPVQGDGRTVPIENGITTICKPDNITVLVNKSVIGEYENKFGPLHLNEQENDLCRGIEHESYYRYTIASNILDCGTTMELNETHINFTNSVSNVKYRASWLRTLADISGSVIVGNQLKAKAMRFVHIKIACTFPLDLNVSTHFPFLPQLTMHFINFNISGRGEFSAIMQLYKTNKFEVAYLSPPTLDVTDTLYVGVSLLETEDDATHVVIKSCWATPTRNPDHLQKYPIVTNSCPLNENLEGSIKLHGNGEGTRVAWEGAVFKFISYEEVWLHCEIKICFGENCRPNCTRTERTRRSAGSDDILQPGAHILSAGPIAKDKERDPKATLPPNPTANAPQESSFLADTTVVIIVAVLSGVIIASCVVIVCVVARLRRHKAQGKASKSVESGFTTAAPFEAKEYLHSPNENSNDYFERTRPQPTTSTFEPELPKTSQSFSVAGANPSLTNCADQMDSNQSYICSPASINRAYIPA